MGHLRSRLQTSEPETDFDRSLEEELLNWVKSTAEIINNGLLFADNFYADIVTVTDTGVADSENNISHDLKKVPTGFILTKTDKAVSVYDSGTAWTDTSIFLKFNTANCNVTLLIF